MMPRPIKCGAALAGGGMCEEFATVTNIQYFYDREPVEGESDGYSLNEIHYRAVCPTCGERTLSKKPAAD